jgi:hypothetical protein
MKISSILNGCSKIELILFFTMAIILALVIGMVSLSVAQKVQIPTF